MSRQSPLALVRDVLEALGEASEDQVVARSGLDRAMVRACIDQLMRLGRAAVHSWKPGFPAAACGMACCGNAGSAGPDSGTPSSVALYRLTENHQKPRISGA